MCAAESVAGGCPELTVVDYSKQRAAGQSSLPLFSSFFQRKTTNVTQFPSLFFEGGVGDDITPGFGTVAAVTLVATTSPRQQVD